MITCDLKNLNKPDVNKFVFPAKKSFKIFQSLSLNLFILLLMQLYFKIPTFNKEIDKTSIPFLQDFINSKKRYWGHTIGDSALYLVEEKIIWEN